MEKGTVQIIYASASGNVESVCEYVAKILADNKISTSMHRAEMVSNDIVDQNRLFLFATSTWEHGAINPYMKPLREYLCTRQLGGKKAGFIGLGDKRYEPVLFCKGIDSLFEAFTNAGGGLIGELLKIDGDPYSQLESLVDPWSVKFIQHLRSYV